MKRIRVKPRFYVILACLVLGAMLIIFGVKGIKKALAQREEPPEIVIEKPKALISVKVSYDGSILTEDSGVTEMIKAFVQKQYEALGNLEDTDMTSFFANPEGEQSCRNQAALSLLIASRKAKPTDLTMKSAECSILIKKAFLNGESYIIEALEDVDCCFNCSENTISKVGGVELSFVIENINNKKSLSSYNRGDDYFSIIDALYQGGTPGQNSLAAAMEESKNKGMSLIAINDEILGGQLKEYLSGVSEESSPVAHPYDRIMAAQYASAYALTRNSEFLDFTLLGGNCQNYASQVMRAGGIPNDMDGDEKWKYYSDAYDISGQAKGRTPSWTSVTGFEEYASGNTGYGLAAKCGVNIYSLEPGDIILCSDAKAQKVHTLVAVGFVYDEAGNPADLLTDSNSVNRKNYPLSAYCYSAYTGIKILGWND